MTLAAFVQKIVDIINPTITLLVAAAVTLFFVGVFRYVQSSASGSAKDNGREMMIWGLVGLVVMVSVGGIVNLAATALFGPLGGTPVVTNRQYSSGTVLQSSSQPVGSSQSFQGSAQLLQTGGTSNGNGSGSNTNPNSGGGSSSGGAPSLSGGLCILGYCL